MKQNNFLAFFAVGISLLVWPSLVQAQALLDPDPSVQGTVRPGIEDAQPPATPLTATEQAEDERRITAQPKNQPDRLNIPPEGESAGDAGALYHRYNGSLRDFKRIYLVCASSDPTHQLSANICAMADAEARMAARSIGFQVEQGNVERDDGFTLAIRVDLAQNVQTAAAVYLEASRFYDKAIDKEASLTSPSAYPRRGKIVMYQKSFISFGRGDLLDDSVREKLRAQIRQFFNQLERQ